MMNEKNCPVCGNTFTENAEQCPVCGFPVISTLHGTEEEKRIIQERAEEYRTKIRMPDLNEEPRPGNHSANRRTTLNMTEGPILKTLITFSLPIFLGLVFQQLYNMVDSIVVGKFVSADALACVGTTGPICMLLVGMVSGFTTGASIVASQLIGAEKYDKIKPTVSTTFIFLIALAAAIMAVGLGFAGGILKLIRVPENIMDGTLTYFRIYIFGMVFLALYNFFASFLRAMGDSVTPLIFLIVSSVLNIFGDLFFVCVLKTGVAGAAWATVIAQAVSVLSCLIYVGRKHEYFRFGKGEFVFDKVLFRSILRLGLPSCLQGSVASIGMVAVQGLINSFGSTSIAAYTAASKMEQLANLPMNSLAQGMSLYVGQNIGASREDRAKSGLYRASVFCFLVSAVLSVVIYVSGPNLMRLFVNEGDLEVIATGARFMRIWAPLIVFHSLCELSIAFLRGTGDSVWSMICMFFDLGIRMIAAYILALLLKLGFMSIAWSLPIGWIVCAGVSWARYLSGGWKKKAIVRKNA